MPVTWPEVIAWTRAVAGLGPESWRWAYYVRAWDVPEKVRAAKRAGTFDQVIAGDGETDRSRDAAGDGAAGSLLRPLAAQLLE